MSKKHTPQPTRKNSEERAPFLPLGRGKGAEFSLMELRKKKVTELRLIAKELGMKGFLSMNKGQLLSALEDPEATALAEREASPDEQLHEKRVTELRLMAREAGVKGCLSMNKRELLKILEAMQ